MSLLRLDQIGPRDRGRVGGKAVGLARLARAGLPVPPTVVIPVEVTRDFLKRNGLWEDAVRGAPGLAERIRAGELDPEFAGQLRTAAARLGELLAVRSSGVDEDGGEASYAGQYETFLGVTPGDATEDALKACWASAYAERVLAYRDGVLPSPGGMAVVVQALVNARCAGVMFTINPLNGSWREMTIEAAWGLGEPVVSGQVVPDYYRVRRPRRSPRPVQRILARVRLELIEELIRPQAEQLAVIPGGLDTIPVALPRQEAPKLRLAELYRLCRLGLRIEGKLSGPQDVEWVQDEAGKFYILQARPVTSTGSVQRSGEVVWTRRFIGERWTEPSTPLGWSVMRELIHWLTAYPETSRRYLGGGEPTRQYRYAPYINATVFRHLAFKLPGAPPPRFMLEMLPPEEERGWLRRHAQPPDIKVYRSIFATTFKERRWRRFRWNLFTNWKAWNSYLKTLDAALPALSEPVTSREGALKRAEACLDLAREYIKVHICSLLFANIWYQVAESALVAGGHSALVSTLLQPPGSSKTALTNQALWQLANGQLSSADFLDRFGHRASNSWELFSPRWRENPETVESLAAATAVGPDPSIAAAKREVAAERDLAKLSRPLRGLVNLTRRYLLLREDQRFHFDRLLWVWKQAYRWLEDDLDLPIRFLERAELSALLSGELPEAEATALMTRRGALWAEESRRWASGDPPPPFLIGDVAPDDPAQGLRLQGLGISAGVVTGPVRVLRSLAEAGRLKPGEILVTQATDPSWTPLFLSASGLVMEMGGMLSHGAVVAREYGLPAVVNVANATGRLSDGQTITVDGSRGVVWVR
ncbi:MAG: phosphohistidine swiveling domain-containing protein [Myxococcota bacterium]|jgi:phosphohistidine swiveling domain-containing protein